MMCKEYNTSVSFEVKKIPWWLAKVLIGVNYFTSGRLCIIFTIIEILCWSNWRPWCLKVSWNTSKPTAIQPFPWWEERDASRKTLPAIKIVVCCLSFGRNTGKVWDIVRSNKTRVGCNGIPHSGAPSMDKLATKGLLGNACSKAVTASPSSVRPGKWRRFSHLG